MARRILVLFAHPVFERSRVNRWLVEAARAVPGVTLHDLYEAYPRFELDVAREQRLLVEHDAIVFQHPFYWYSAPSLLKEWQDLVLEHGWAYGRGGDHLAGKPTLNAITTGGPAVAYQRTGRNHFTMRELLTPFEATARLCGMRFLAPFVVHGSLAMRTREDVAPHAERYVRLLNALATDTIDLERAAVAANLHDELDGLLRGGER